MGARWWAEAHPTTWMLDVYEIEHPTFNIERSTSKETMHGMLKRRPDDPRRKRLRLREYDYTSYGAYFVTIVTQDRRHMFGRVTHDEMVLTTVGEVVWDAWDALPVRFPSVELDLFVVMSNHVHGIVWLLDEPMVALDEGAAGGSPTAAPVAAPALVGRPTLGDVMRVFKSISAIEVNRANRSTGDVWQRNYFEKIVRSQRQLDALRRYIDENPLRWALDEENDLRRP